jgi:hypothetical protein
VVTDPAGGSDPVDVAAAVTKATVLDVAPASLAPGVVGEVCVAADPTDVETTPTKLPTTTTSPAGWVAAAVKVRTLPGET